MARSAVRPIARPHLIIFDCDGVLVDSELIDTRVRSECLQAEGFSMTAEELGANSGISGKNLVKLIEDRFGRPLPEGFMEATRAKIMTAFINELRAIDGISELLRSLTVPVCVASNSHVDRIRHALQVTHLLEFFDPHVFSAIMVKRGKPAPDLFLLATERLNISPANCLVVEDSVHGVTAAKAAGMEVLGFCGGSHCELGHADRLLQAGCKHVFPHMSEVGEFIRSLERGYDKAFQDDAVRLANRRSCLCVDVPWYDQTHRFSEIVSRFPVRPARNPGCDSGVIQSSEPNERPD